MKFFSLYIIIALLQVISSNAQTKISNASEPMIALDYQSFNSKIHDLSKNKSNLNYLGNKNAILFFHAKACSSCERLKPIYQQAAKKWAAKYVFYSVDADLYPNLQIFGGNHTPAIVSISLDSSFQAYDGDLSLEDLEMFLEIMAI